MQVEQLYTSCLAQGAYFIQSEGEAAVIDPLREYQPYLDLAAKNNAKIKYIFETHFHADFVSGHLDLAKIPERKSYSDQMLIQSLKVLLQPTIKSLKSVN